MSKGLRSPRAPGPQPLFKETFFDGKSIEIPYKVMKKDHRAGVSFYSHFVSLSFWDSCSYIEADGLGAFKFFAQGPVVS